MAATAVNLTSPFAMQNATLTLSLADGTDETDYTAAVAQAEWQPTAGQAWRGIGGNRVAPDPDWNLVLSFAQDDDPESLARFLLANPGKTATATLTPRAGGTSYSADVSLTPGAIGGTAGNTLATASATLPAHGAPVPTDPAEG